MASSHIAIALLGAALAAAVGIGSAKADSFSWDNWAAPSNGTSPTSTTGILGNWTATDATTSALTWSGAGHEIIGNGAAKTTTGTVPLSPDGGHFASSADVVMFELPTGGYRPTSVLLQQWCANQSSAGAFASTKTCAGVGSNGHDDVSVHVGVGDAVGGLGAVNGLKLADLMAAAGNDRSVNLGAAAPGDDLIVAASLNDGATTGQEDFFKIVAVSADSKPSTSSAVIDTEDGIGVGDHYENSSSAPDHMISKLARSFGGVATQVTLAILGLGVAGLLLARRRGR
jgi:hypothetical protein